MTQWRYGEITEIVNEGRHSNVTRFTLYLLKGMKTLDERLGTKALVKLFYCQIM